MLTTTVTKRELISSISPVMTLDHSPPPGLLSTTLHPAIDGVLQATSHVNSNVLLFILLHVTSYKCLVAAWKN